MYVLFVIAIFLLSALTARAQQESTPSSTVAPSITLSISNKPEQDDEAHRKNQLRKQAVSPTLLPTKIHTSEEPTVTFAPSLLPGDANEDGQVNESDYNIWHGFYKQTVTGKHIQGDFNNDGVTDGVDYTIWLANLTQE